MTFKLYSHQQKIIDEDKPVSGLFMGTGSGKTRTALMLARGNTLVIAPKTQVEDGNWFREWDKIDMEDDHVFPLKVISKETFRRDWEKLPRFDTIIIDEAHTVLGVTPNVRWVKKQAIPKASQLFEAVGQYIMLNKPSRVYLCTATPIRSPMTVWGAAKLLGQKWDWYKFRDKFYIRLPMPGREVYQPKNDVATKNKLGELVRKLGYTGQLSDYFDVPEQTYKTIHVDLTSAQRVRLKELPFEYPDPIVLVGKKHQVEQGILSGDEFNKPEEFKNEKIDTILELALEFPRMVIFAKYRAQISAIASTLRTEGHKVLEMTGDTKDRGALIAEANQAKECIFIAQAQVSSGWELPEYPTMVFASMSYSVVDRIQAEGRIHRANALKKNLYITLVARGGIDEAVAKCIDNKKDFQEAMYATGK